MTRKYEETVARMAAFNQNDESAKVAGKEEAGSEIIRGPLKQTGQNTNLGKD